MTKWLEINTRMNKNYYFELIERKGSMGGKFSLTIHGIGDCLAWIWAPSKCWKNGKETNDKCTWRMRIQCICSWYKNYS